MSHQFQIVARRTREYDGARVLTIKEEGKFFTPEVVGMGARMIEWLEPRVQLADEYAQAIRDMDPRDRTIGQQAFLNRYETIEREAK